MKMTMRWFGSDDDSVTLEQIKQIPNVQVIAGGLHHIPAGEIWPIEEIRALKEQVEAAGLKLEVIESVNVHDAIKQGRADRDLYIDNYIQTLKNLSLIGIKVICYNFMPVFDWTRSSLFKELKDGSTTMEYVSRSIEDIDPLNIAGYMMKQAENYSLPGWEPERLNVLQELFRQYKGISEDDLRDNLKYFLERIIPVCEELDISMAIHPDDPPWPIFGLPRIVKNRNDYDLIMAMNPSEKNGMTLCTGCLGSNRDNNVVSMIRHFGSSGRLHFVHLRNILFSGERDFCEVSHFTEDGSLDMYEIVKALHETDFKGYARPDHGRMIWGEKARPGYGLYDRALGITYINGLREAIVKGCIKI